MTQTLIDRDLLIEPPIVLRLRPAIKLIERQLSKICALNSELRIEQTKEGDLVIMPPTHTDSGITDSNPNWAVNDWSRRHSTGIAFSASTGFRLPNGAMRSPDAAWIRKERWAALPPQERHGKFARICPDFVVELRSDTHRLSVLRAKMDECNENGALLSWLIDPYEKKVHIHRPGRAPEVPDDPAIVSGDPELPGFALDIAKLWENVTL